MLSYVCTPLTPSPSPHAPRKGASLSPPTPTAWKAEHGQASPHFPPGVGVSPRGGRWPKPHSPSPWVTPIR